MGNAHRHRNSKNRQNEVNTSSGTKEKGLEVWNLRGRDAFHAAGVW